MAQNSILYISKQFYLIIPSLMVNNGSTRSRFVCVLNKKVELGRLMNALGHMTAGLISLHAQDLAQMRFQTYVDQDHTEHKNISDNPFIVLKADNGNQIRTLRNMLRERNILFTDFTDTMVEDGYIEQHARTNATAESSLDYFGICFFASDEVAKDLTKKFSLFK